MDRGPHTTPSRRTAAAGLLLLVGAPLWPSSARASWAPYLDLLTKDKSNGVRYAAIYGQDGAKWASNIDAKPGEIAGLVAGLKDVSRFQTSGIVFAGVRYQYLTLRSPAGVVGRKGPAAILLRATLRSVLIVITQDGANPANITSIDFVADDLMKKKF